MRFQPVTTREFGAVVEGDRAAVFLVEFSEPFPGMVFLDLMGLPQSDRMTLQKMVDATGARIGLPYSAEAYCGDCGAIAVSAAAISLPLRKGTR